MHEELRKHRKRLPDQRREQLLDAAETVLAENGSKRISVAEVTKAAGLAKGTFYLYFHSREGLLQALRERYEESVTVYMASVQNPPPEGDWFRFVDRAVRLAVGLLIEQSNLRMAFAANGSVDGSFEGRDALRERFVGAVREGTRRRKYRVSDPEFTGDMVFSMVLRAGELGSRRPGKERRIARETARSIRRVLGEVEAQPAA